MANRDNLNAAQEELALLLDELLAYLKAQDMAILADAELPLQAALSRLV